MNISVLLLLLTVFSVLMINKGIAENNSFEKEYIFEKDSSERKNKKSKGISTYKQKWVLPAILSEISGISFIDTSKLACVQDELGVIYTYDLTKSVLINEIKFAKPGDYEGIAVVGEDAWILRSDGKLFQVQNFQKNKPNVKDVRLPFHKEINLEGLCYDKKNNRLLILPRSFDTPDTTFKGIYSYNLITGKLSDEPIYKVDLTHQLLNQKERKKKKKEALIPSGIAIHPFTGNLYLIDAKNAQIVILDNKGRIDQLVHLNKKAFAKTEGIAFTNKGEIFLSNEGKKQSPNILKIQLE